MTGRGRQQGQGRARATVQRGATTLGLIGAAVAQGPAADAAAPAFSPPPLAECHDMALSFDHVTAQSYDVVVTAVVTRPGVFALGEGHAYFGTSSTPPDPAGVVMTSTEQVITPEPGSTVDWRASCVGGSATGTVHVPAAAAPPRVSVSGPVTARATSHAGAADPLHATAVDGAGHRLAAHCAPAVLPLTPSRTTVTCTSAPDAAGRVGRARRVVTVAGAGPQLLALRDALPAGHLRDLVEAAHDAVVRRDGPAAARRLGLVLDAVPAARLSATRAAQVRSDVQRIGKVLGTALPLVHAVVRGDTVWSVVTDALQHRTGAAPSDAAVAAGVRLVLAANPGALDRYGVLHEGTVLTLPL